MEIKEGKDYIDQVKNLIVEYTNRLGRDLTFQDLEAELKNPELKYTPPEGELLVAVEGDEVIGMVAYHRHTNKRCEMKRLYVKPQMRGSHLGGILVGEIISRAKDAGFAEMVLDTIKPLTAAIHLYQKHGFMECSPYYDNPMDDVIYMTKEL